MAEMNVVTSKHHRINRNEAQLACRVISASAELFAKFIQPAAKHFQLADCECANKIFLTSSVTKTSLFYSHCQLFRKQPACDG